MARPNFQKVASGRFHEGRPFRFPSSIPSMVGRAEQVGDDGEEANPSAWEERWKVLVLAAVGFSIAMYLALYQWQVFKSVWEPFFGDGSQKVLHSFISRLLPVPDAFLGALGYLADIVTGAIGGAQRWRTLPWMVMIYGATVFGVGATALALAIIQPTLIHAGCTLCLCSALISICIAWLARREVMAAWRQLRR